MVERSQPKKPIEHKSKRIPEGTKRDIKRKGGKLPNFIGKREEDLRKSKTSRQNQSPAGMNDWPNVNMGSHKFEVLRNLIYLGSKVASDIPASK
uniref:Uncharacterized protein n=1 Tax=Megaselia scalaris TaxID=36166 RepID=T1GTB3_MEGSC